MAMVGKSLTTTEKRELPKPSENSGEPPPHYVLGEAGRLASSYSSQHMSAGIPTVDLRRLLQSDGSSCSVEEMAKLRSGLGSWGLFQATGHGIPPPFLDEVRRVGLQFFKLPMQEKERYSSKGKYFNEGYGSDPIDPKAPAVDWTNRILLQVEPENQRKLELWPENPSSFRDTVHEYAARGKVVAELSLRAMAISLDLDETHFVKQLDSMMVYCRFSHYPPCSRPELVLGLKPHSDNSVLTVILQAGDVEGLEIFKDGVWVRVPYNPDVLLVQAGDLLEIMSNGMFKSSVHRVVAHTQERFSTSLFYGMEPEKQIGPAEKLLKEGMPRRYKDLKVEDYTDVHTKSFSEGKRSINWAKV